MFVREHIRNKIMLSIKNISMTPTQLRKPIGRRTRGTLKVYTKQKQGKHRDGVGRQLIMSLNVEKVSSTLQQNYVFINHCYFVENLISLTY